MHAEPSVIRRRLRMRRTFVCAGLLLAAATVADAAQVVLGRRFQVVDPLPGRDASRRRIFVSGRDRLGGDHLAGNPTVAGATLQIAVTGGASVRQHDTFFLPPSGWTRLPADPAYALVGYRYDDPQPGQHGPVRRAYLKQAGGTFLFTASLHADNGTGPQPRIRLIPPDPGTSAGAILTIPDGDTYCLTFGEAAGGRVENSLPESDIQKRFQIRTTVTQPTREAGCMAVRPNIVVVLTDDQRWDTVDATHSRTGVDPVMPEVMDTLAGRGVTFSQAFQETPLCTPSRVAFLTGRHAHRSGATTNFFVAPPGLEASTIGTWLRQAGYRTGFFGKYPPRSDFLRPPGWDEWQAFTTIRSYNYTLTNNGNPVTYGSAPADYATDVLAQKVLDFIDVDSARPFFAVLAPYAPHAEDLLFPTPAPRHVGTFFGMPLVVGPSYDEADLTGKPSWVLGASHASADSLGRITYGSFSFGFRQHQLESLQAVDEAVGAIVRALERRNLADDTAVIFTSDNGLMWGEHRLWQLKTVAYEESARAPLIIRYPRLAPVARVSDAFILNIDLAPTIAELAGTTPGGPVDGQSLLPLLTGAATTGRPDVLLQGWREPASRWYAAVRDQRWKYVEYDTSEAELYDLLNDPYELTNLATDAANAPLRASLSARIAELLQ